MSGLRRSLSDGFHYAAGVGFAMGWEHRSVMLGSAYLAAVWLVLAVAYLFIAGLVALWRTRGDA